MKTTAQILADLSAEGRPEASAPELLCVDCMAELTMTGAGLSLMNEAGPQGVIGASGPLAATMEDLQFELGEGPALDASRDSAPVLLADLEPGGLLRWPVFARTAALAGVRAMFALPLHVGAVRLGSLSLYRSTPGHLGEEEMATALAYADAAVLVLLRLQEQMVPGLELHADLLEPLSYRAEVHQATGFLSVQASVGLTEALLLLRAHAFAHDRPLLQIARDVLSGRIQISPEGDVDD